MKTLSLLRLSTAVVFAGLLCGCETAQRHSLTYKLWDKASRPTCQPLPQPNLAAFASPTNQDVLVAYDAVSERQDKVERRAYFVLANEARVLRREKPDYVDPSISTQLIPVSVVVTTNMLRRDFWTVRYPASTDYGVGFELFRDGRSEAVHPLPIYTEENFGTVSRVAVTPLAVVGDTLMLSGVVATFGLLLWLEVGAPPFGHTH